jgi:hypothetical protein
MTSVETFAFLEPWFDRLVRSLDLAMILEHVRRLEPMAFARHFKGFRPQTLGRKRVGDALRFEVFQKKNVAVADILVLLWNQEHRDLYHAMLEHVKTINEDVEAVERIEDDKAKAFVEDLRGRFDPADLLLCVRLNEVRFSAEMIATLERDAGGDVVAVAAATPRED